MTASHDPHASPATDPLSLPAVRTALACLLEGYTLAQDLRVPLGEFAVPLSILREAGCSPNAMLWLVRKGYAAHTILTTAGKPARRKASSQPRDFSEGTRFVLSDLGVPVARAVANRLPLDDQRAGSRPTVLRLTPQLDLPDWHTTTGELHFRGQVVLTLRREAGNQRPLLDALQKAGWPKSLDDPLPPPTDPETDARQRLRNTVKALNRRLRVPLLHFCCLASGRAVGWQPLG